MFKFTIIAVILFIATAGNIIAAIISWNRVKTRFGLYFAIGITSHTLWALASGLDYAAVSIPLKVFFAKWEYLFYNTAHAFFLLFLLYYAGYVELARSKYLRTALIIGCGTNILLAWTNDWHHWLWSGFSQGAFGNNTIIFEHGPAFLWVAGTGYLLYLSILLSAWMVSRRGSLYSRRQGYILFVAFLLPLLGNLIYQFELPEFKGMDWTSAFASISVIICVWALYGTKLLDLIPIAREKLIDSLSDGMIVLDMQSRIVDMNQPAARMVNTPLAKMLGRYIADVLPFSQSYVAQPPDKETRIEIEIGDHYFDVLISPLVESKNTVIGRLVMFRDVTDRKQNELRLLQLTQAVEQSPASVVITDLDGIITYVNPKFTKLTGYTREEAIGNNPRIVKSGQTPVEVYQEMWTTIKSGKVWQGEVLNRKKNGELYWESSTIAPVLDEQGQPIYFVAIKEDITERKRVQDELQWLARTDALTGLFNRRYFFETAEKEFTKSIRYDRPLSLIIFDIDLFKEVNDTFGHLVGDQVIAYIGKLLRDYGRETDIAARYGGEEFVILLTETDRVDAQLVAERLRKLMEASFIQDERGEVRFTASFGVASKDKDTKSFDQLVGRADQALYHAKNAGRNRVVCHK